MNEIFCSPTKRKESPISATAFEQLTSFAPMVAFARFCESIGISAVTGWRWRKLGWIDVINVSGKLYVTAEAMQVFMRRARAGEFAKAGVGVAGKGAR